VASRYLTLHLAEVAGRCFPSDSLTQYPLLVFDMNTALPGYQRFQMWYSALAVTGIATLALDIAHDEHVMGSPSLRNYPAGFD